MLRKVRAARNPVSFSRTPGLLIVHPKHHAPISLTAQTTSTAPMTITVLEETSITSISAPRLSALNAAPQDITPENAPIPRSLSNAPMHLHRTMVQAAMEMVMARMPHPAGMLLLSEAVCTTSMLKRLKKRQMLCWVRFLSTQYLQLFCLILVLPIRLLPKSLFLREV